MKIAIAASNKTMLENKIVQPLICGFVISFFIFASKLVILK
jgi:hypothetical protein